jgi:hypothetical protein
MTATFDTQQSIHNLSSLGRLADHLGQAVMGDHQLFPGVIGENLEFAQTDSDFVLEDVHVIVQVEHGDQRHQDRDGTGSQGDE